MARRSDEQRWAAGLTAHLRTQYDMLREPATDATGVHRARVAARRLAAAITVLRPFLDERVAGKLLRRLKRRRREWSARRDLDVSIELLGTIGSKHSAEAAALVAGWQSPQRTPADAIKLISPPRFESLLTALAAGVGEIRVSLGGAVLSTAMAFATIATPASDDPHAVRLAAKRWRDTLELAAATGLKVSTRTIGRVRQLQRRLGRWHDRVVLVERILADAVPRLHRGRDVAPLLGIAGHFTAAATRELAAFDRDRMRFATPTMPRPAPADGAA